MFDLSIPLPSKSVNQPKRLTPTILRFWKFDAVCYWLSLSWFAMSESESDEEIRRRQWYRIKRSNVFERTVFLAVFFVRIFMFFTFITSQYLSFSPSASGIRKTNWRKLQPQKLQRHQYRQFSSKHACKFHICADGFIHIIMCTPIPSVSAVRKQSPALLLNICTKIT